MFTIRTNVLFNKSYIFETFAISLHHFRNWRSKIQLKRILQFFNILFYNSYKCIVQQKLHIWNIRHFRIRGTGSNRRGCFNSSTFYFIIPTKITHSKHSSFFFITFEFEEQDPIEEDGSILQRLQFVQMYCSTNPFSFVIFLHHFRIRGTGSNRRGCFNSSMFIIRTNVLFNKSYTFETFVIFLHHFRIRGTRSNRRGCFNSSTFYFTISKIIHSKHSSFFFITFEFEEQDPIEEDVSNLQHSILQFLQIYC